MKEVSTEQKSSATEKRPKTHLSRSKITRKIVAFQELTSLKGNKQSARSISSLLEIPKSTMHSWINQKESFEKKEGLKAFINTPEGAEFLQKNIMAIMKLMKCGPSGIRRMQEYLNNSGLAIFVA